MSSLTDVLAGGRGSDEGGSDTSDHSTGDPEGAGAPFTMAAVTVGSPDVRAVARFLPLVLAFLLGMSTMCAPPSSAGQRVSPTSGGSDLERSARAAAAAPDPLQVSIDRLSPTALEQGDVVRVNGTITNVDESAWRSINAFLVMSAGPLTTAQEVQDAADSPDTSYFGDRVVNDGTFASIGGLAPGESADYTVEVPYRALGISGASGVYQLGIQVIGTDENGFRSTTATGRARTFLPSVDDQNAAQVHTSVLWPLLSRVRRLAGGTVADPDRLVRLCGAGGRLRTMLDMARANADAPMTLVVDPGLLDELGKIARGTGSATDGSDDAEEDASTEETDADDSAANVAALGSDSQPEIAGALADYVRAEPTEGESMQQRTARVWLRDLIGLANDVPVWATGYAQPDLAALPTRGSRDRSSEPLSVARADRLRAASDRATEAALRSLDLTARRVWWPPAELADEEALTRAAAQADASVVSSTLLPQWTSSSPSTLRVATADGESRVVVDNESYLDGGPGPGNPNSALQVRQRIAAETALQSMSLSAQGRRSGSATVVLGRSWDPGSQWSGAAFARAFGTSWTRHSTLEQQLAGRTGTYQASAIAAEPVAAPLPSTITRQAGALDRRSRVLGELLRGAEATDAATLFYDEVTAMAISQQWRTKLGGAERFVQDSVRALATSLSSVSVEIPPYVTLTSDSGSFGVTINNRIDQAITVGVIFDSARGQLTLPDLEPISIGAGESRTVLVDASIPELAAELVTARLVTTEKNEFGRAATFTVRTSPLGVAIWIALGAGAGFVLLVVARRSWRQRRTDR